MPSATSNQTSTRDGQPRGATGWLALAASPTFALMALVAANDAAAMPYCSAASGLLPIGGMTAMYLLMSLFHLSPWLRLASGRTWARS
ncbi:MAG TPA: hypothetical protein VMB34_13855 [Acetobacteraceae bacterium]|nr:hypothetical protein [Acetobacteraceae bacterium]